MTTDGKDEATEEMRPVPVTIFEQPYSLRSDEDPAYVASLAEYMDERMREVADRTQTADTLKLAILAGLNITDELFHLRREATAPKELKKRVARIESILDDALTRP